MSEIVLERVSKTWGGTRAVDQLSVAIPAAALVVLLGPSGCGKSTTLRMIAGLEEVSAGRILIDGRPVTHLPPSARKVSMVFQSYALFPHLNVAENIVFGLRVRRVGRDERERRLARVAEMVGLGELLARKPSQLSGGQRQRVALARAIIAENTICLMDEPLSNLDAKLRHEMRVEIRELQQRLGMTVVYVTHDQSEAMSLADKVVLMRDGRAEQEGTPDELYEWPATTFAAGFIGTPPMNLLDLEALARSSEGRAAGSDLIERYGGRVLGLRPEHIEIDQARNIGQEGGGLVARLVSTDYLGADTTVVAELAGQSLAVRVPGRFNRGARGETVCLTWREESVRLFEPGSGHRVTEADNPTAVVRPLSATKEGGMRR